MPMETFSDIPISEVTLQNEAYALLRSAPTAGRLLDAVARAILRDAEERVGTDRNLRAAKDAWASLASAIEALGYLSDNLPELPERKKRTADRT